MSTGAGRAGQNLARLPVTTTDLLKAAGLAFVIVDHIGLFLLPEQEWWRVFGRAAAPVFFFLIGFGRGRDVPWTWFALGFALTALDFVSNRSTADMQLNLLLSFALLRAARPHAEALASRPAALVLAAGLLVGLIPVLAPFLEYGAEGWLWALFGLAQRQRLDEPPGRAGTLAALAVAITAGVAYWATERQDYGFAALQSTVLAGLIGSLAALLWQFRRAEVPGPSPAGAARILRFCGRRSLEIYGVTLFVMQLLGYALHGPQGDDPDDADT